MLDALLNHPKADSFSITLYVRSAEKVKKFEDMGLGLKTIPGTLEQLEAAAATHHFIYNCVC